MQAQQTSKAAIYGGMARQFFIRLSNKIRMMKTYAPIRNRIFARNGALIIGGFLLAHGFIVIGVMLILIGSLIDEL